MSENRDQDPLPMDQASRMARAKEQGFDADTVYYHGTLAKREIDRFRPSQDGILGKGVYMSRSPEVAERYAGYHRRTEPGGSMYPTHVKGKLWSVEERGLPRDTYKGTNDDIVKALEGEGFHGVDSGHETVVFDPANIRSVNDAFDPRYLNEPKLIGGAPATVEPELDEHQNHQYQYDDFSPGM